MIEGIIKILLLILLQLLAWMNRDFLIEFVLTLKSGRSRVSHSLLLMQFIKNFFLVHNTFKYNHVFSF